ncbi:MAG: 2-oxoacid:acceptor oxidoreductase family protein [Lachnospiraceae bacterium]|nr:2-oxoacid:acceptor oxidoreductase family protein [Lachnospiraceae bacterium]
MGVSMNQIFEQQDYYGIRLESIGGLGANLCGKMVGELAVRYLNLNSAGFSSYGSEKTGTPVKGYIRFCPPEKEIRVHSPVVNPDLLVIFHQALMRDPSVWKGCSDRTTVIIALDQGQEEAMMQNLPDIMKDCYVVNARQIAMETKSRINVVMLGAMAKVMGFVELEAARQICRDNLGRKYPAALEGNLKGLEQGYAQVQRLEETSFGILKKGSGSVVTPPDSSQEWGYATAPIGGVNPRSGSTVTADLSPSRQGYVPIFLKERCINCGLCDSTCPDMVFQFAKGTFNGREMMVNRGLDYYHCKGCMRCVDVCPVNALVRGVEAEHPDKKYFMPNQDMLRTPDYYVKTGPDGYITSESYLTEKRIEGGEV